MLHGFLFNQEPGIASLFEFSVGFAVMAAAVGLGRVLINAQGMAALEGKAEVA
jgi:hypothetical protein